MNDNLLKNAKRANLLYWGAAILLPILMRSTASKDPKIFEFLIPVFQMLLALGATKLMVDSIKGARTANTGIEDPK